MQTSEEFSFYPPNPSALSPVVGGRGGVVGGTWVNLLQGMCRWPLRTPTSL